jgi:hypothetical protein
MTYDSNSASLHPQTRQALLECWGIGRKKVDFLEALCSTEEIQADEKIFLKLNTILDNLNIFRLSGLTTVEAQIINSKKNLMFSNQKIGSNLSDEIRDYVRTLVDCLANEYDPKILREKFADILESPGTHICDVLLEWPQGALRVDSQFLPVINSTVLTITISGKLAFSEERNFVDAIEAVRIQQIATQKTNG